MFDGPNATQDRTTERPASPWVRSDWWMGTLIFCSVAAVYSPSWHGALIMDDRDFITRARLRSLAGLGQIWTEIGATKQYYPVLHSAFWVEHKLWGDSLLAYHLLNDCLHAGAACLFALLLRAWRIPGAWLAGLLFGLHPVCVESVAWISEQKNTLSMVFYLMAALAYVRFDQRRTAGSGASRCYIWATLFFSLALLSKSVTATLPAALLVVRWWRRGVLEWRRDVVPLLPWFALSAADGLFTSWVERKVIGAQGADFAMPLAGRALVAGRAIWFYLGKIVWPVNLSFIYPRWVINPAMGWQYLFPAGILGLALALWQIRHRSRAPLATALIFAGTLFPVLGFFNVYFFLYSFVADHFQYLAILSIVALAASGWAHWAKIQRAAALVAALAVLVGLGALTWRQNRTYRNGETLYRAVLRLNPDSWMAHNNLGDALIDLPGRKPEAIAHYEAVLKLKPDFAPAHYNLGNAWLQTPGRLADAVAEYQTALRLVPDYAAAHNNLGTAWQNLPGRLADAIGEYEAALRIDPNYAEAHNNLGNAWLKVPGHLTDAVSQYEMALRLEPNYAEAHYDLANAWSLIPGRSNEAVAEYQTVLHLRPNFAEAHNNLGNLWLKLPGRRDDAVAEFEAALRLNPDFAEAHYNLALALARQPGRTREAMEHLRAFARLRPQSGLAREIRAELGEPPR